MKKKIPQSPEAALLTIPEACQVLRLSRATLYRAMDKRDLHYVKYGASRRIKKEDLDGFVDAMRV